MTIKQSPFVLCFALLSIVLSSCKQQYVPKPYEKPLEIVKISEQSYVHVSYIKTATGSFIPCNGYIYVSGEEAIVFDTPLNDSISNQLIDFIHDNLKVSIKGLVVNHSHYDAAGGVNAFAKANINTYASARTAKLLEKEAISISHPFEEEQQITINGGVVHNFFIGEAHTSDNIVSYIPSEKLIYGGCMIKSLNADKGNVADANLDSWASTVETVQKQFPDVETVIPGHGAIGDKSLLDYTIALFHLDFEEKISNLE